MTDSKELRKDPATSLDMVRWVFAGALAVVIAVVKAG